MPLPNSDKFDRLASSNLTRLFSITPISLNILQFLGPEIFEDLQDGKIKNPLFFLQLLAGYMALRTNSIGYRDTLADIDNLLAIGAVLSDQQSTQHVILREKISFNRDEYELDVCFSCSNHLDEISVKFGDTHYAGRINREVNIYSLSLCTGISVVKGIPYLVYVDKNNPNRSKKVSLRKFLESGGFEFPNEQYSWSVFESKKSKYSDGRKILEEISVIFFNYALIFGSAREKNNSFLDRLYALKFGENAENLSRISEDDYHSKLFHLRCSNFISQCLYCAKVILPFIMTVSSFLVIVVFKILSKEVTALKVRTNEYFCYNQTDIMRNISHFCQNIFFQMDGGWKVLIKDQNETISGYLDTSGYLDSFLNPALCFNIAGIAVSLIIMCCIKKPFLDFTSAERYLTSFLMSLAVQPTDFYIQAREKVVVNPLSCEAGTKKSDLVVSGLWRHHKPDAFQVRIPTEPFNDLESATLRPDFSIL